MVEPVIAPGTAGGFSGVIVKHLGVLEPQPLLDVTQISPAAVPTVTLMEVVPWPELIVYPPGTDQVYEEAPVTAAIE